jgi:hypothetical protein
MPSLYGESAQHTERPLLNFFDRYSRRNPWGSTATQRQAHRAPFVFEMCPQRGGEGSGRRGSNSRPLRWQGNASNSVFRKGRNQPLLNGYLPPTSTGLEADRTGIHADNTGLHAERKKAVFRAGAGHDVPPAAVTGFEPPIIPWRDAVAAGAKALRSECGPLLSEVG